MTDEFIHFLKEPTRVGFLELRSQQLADPDFDPYSQELDDLPELMEGEQYEEAIELIREHIRPNHILSPGAHMRLGFALHRMEDEDQAQVEIMIASALAKGIGMTGDGSEESPLLVTRCSDEYDYLLSLQLTCTGQRLVVSDDDRELDVLSTEEGEEIHFDVTDIRRRLKRRMGIEG